LTSDAGGPRLRGAARVTPSRQRARYAFRVVHLRVDEPQTHASGDVTQTIAFGGKKKLRLEWAGGESAEDPHVRCVMLTGRAARGDADAEARAPVPKQTPRNALVFPR
jgi:hypothetical protein